MALNEIQQHIQSTKKTAKITNAMRMVSRNKVNHTIEMAQSYQIYSDYIKQTLQQLHYTLKLTPPKFTKPEIAALITQRPIKRIGIFLMTTDKGLAGSYNPDLLNQVDQWINDQNLTQDQELVFYTLGRVGEKYCQKHNYKIMRAYYPLSDQPSFEEAHHFIRQLRQAFVEKECDELYLAYHHESNGSQSKFNIDKLLPVLALNKPAKLDANLDPEELITKVYLIEPSVEAVLEGMIPHYIEAKVYGALLQAKTTEHFARMTAMQSATDNANAMIADLKLKYNQERQVKVTNEILEIVAGAQAQQKERRK